MRSTDISRNIALLVNPVSGKGKSVETGNWIARQLEAQNITYAMFKANWPQDLIHFSDVWIVGGDGTINYFLNHYPGNKLPLAIFRAGTGNDLAWKLNGEISLSEELEIALNERPRPIDAAKCNDTFYINSSGIGFDGEVLRSMRAIRILGGHLGYLSVVLKKIFSFKEADFIIEADNINHSGKHLLVIVNNSSRTGGGFMVTPKASLTDGKLDMLLCKKLSVWKRLRYLPVIEKGNHLQLPFIVHRQVESVRIRSVKEVYAQLDGELIQSKEFYFQILPGMLQVRHHTASS